MRLGARLTGLPYQRNQDHSCMSAVRCVACTLSDKHLKMIGRLIGRLWAVHSAPGSLLAGCSSAVHPAYLIGKCNWIVR
jgi:hypothetical protein